jgi:lipopolysaccharide export LptBFGC system permease protein LptF
MVRSFAIAAEVGTGSLQSWIRANVIPLLLLVIAAALLMVAQRGDNARAMRIVAGVVVALAVLGLSSGGNAEAVGSWLWKLVTGA